MPSRYSYQSRDPRAHANPLRSMALLRPVAQVFGPTALEAAEGEVRYATNLLAGHLRDYATECAALGKANRMGPATCRWHQAQALRTINARRKAIRLVRVRLATAEASLAALQPIAPASTFRVLAQRTGGTERVAKVVTAPTGEDAMRTAQAELQAMGFYPVRAAPIASAPIGA